MTDSILSIFIGVFSGILTSTIIWISIRIFKDILIPWYQQKIHRGIDISGKWTSKQTFDGGASAQQSIELIQKGHKIKGKLISINKLPSKGEDTTSFDLNGEIFDNYLSAEYRIIDKKLIGRGTLLMKVKEGGEKLVGGLVAIDRLSTEVIVYESIDWTRKK